MKVFLILIGLIIFLLVLLTASKSFKETKYVKLYNNYNIDTEKMRLRYMYNL